MIAIGVSAAAPSASAQQLTATSWTLWEVTDRTETRRVEVLYETRRVGHAATPVDRDLDRARCDWLKQLRIGDRFRSDDRARAVPDGVLLRIDTARTLETVTTTYLCLPTGTTPHRPPAEALIRTEAPPP